jgi:hypothetical protein
MVIQVRLVRNVMAVSIALAAAMAANAGQYPVLRDSSGSFNSQAQANAQALLQVAQQQGYVRVEIALRSNTLSSQGELPVAPITLEQRRAEALQAVDQFKTTLSDGKKPVARDYSEVTLDPFFNVNLTASEVTQLLSNPNVKSFSDVTYFKPFLNQVNNIVQTSGLPLMRPNAQTQHYMGVIDSGVDSTHSAFGGRVFAGACFPTTGANSLCTGRSNVGFPPASGQACSGVTNCGHGTHVAGIAASSDFVAANSGMAPTASVFSIMAAERSPIAPQFYEFTAVELNNALNTLIQNVSFSTPGNSSKRLAAVNLSLGEPLEIFQSCESSGLASITANITNLTDNLGVSVVAATGNTAGQFAYPACLPQVLSVSAVNKQDQPLTQFSLGAAFRAPDLLAPGGSRSHYITGDISKLDANNTVVGALGGVTVSVSTTTNQPVMSTTTDSAGRFQVLLLPGSYRISLSRPSCTFDGQQPFQYTIVESDLFEQYFAMGTNCTIPTNVPTPALVIPSCSLNGVTEHVCATRNGGGNEARSGTSMSAPVLTGLVTRLRDRFPMPSRSFVQKRQIIEDVLINSGVAKTVNSNNTTFVVPRVDARRAFAEATRAQNVVVQAPSCGVRTLNWTAPKAMEATGYFVRTAVDVNQLNGNGTSVGSATSFQVPNSNHAVAQIRAVDGFGDGVWTGLSVDQPTISLPVTACATDASLTHGEVTVTGKYGTFTTTHTFTVSAPPGTGFAPSAQLDIDGLNTPPSAPAGWSCAATAWNHVQCTTASLQPGSSATFAVSLWNSGTMPQFAGSALLSGFSDPNQANNQVQNIFF